MSFVAAEVETAQYTTFEPAEPEEILSPEFLKARTADYWQKRGVGRGGELEINDPWPDHGMDTGLAERVIGSVTFLHSVCQDVLRCDGGWMVDAVLDSDRGAWVVRTVLRHEAGIWRVDPVRTRVATMRLYLGQHRIHPPYTGENSARGRAMEFWHQVARRDLRRARALVTPESRNLEIPAPGQGHIDEFVWYVRHEQQQDSGCVQVLRNTRDDQRMLFTQMVQTSGAWCVDLAATLERSGYSTEAVSR